MRCTWDIKYSRQLSKAFAQRVSNLTRCANVINTFVDSLGLTMGMGGILSGYTVVQAYSESSSSSRPTTISPPSWDLGIIVYAHGDSRILAFPTMFAPGILSRHFEVVARSTDNDTYTSLPVFTTVSTSSIAISGNAQIAFILFSAEK